jgi:hypothetical protein
MDVGMTLVAMKTEVQKEQAKEEGQNAATKNGVVDRWDELEFLERYVGDDSMLVLQELIHAICSGNSSMGGTGDQDRFKRAEEGIDYYHRPNGISPRDNHSQILRRESLEQPREPKTRHYTDSGCTDALNIGNLTDMSTERHGLRTLKDDNNCVCKAGVAPVGWSRQGFDEDMALYENELEEYEEVAMFLLPPIAEERPNSPLSPGWTRVEITSGRISWPHETSILSFCHLSYSEYIAFGCEGHASCMRIYTHPFNSATQDTLERRWVYIWDAFPEDYVHHFLCMSNPAYQMTPVSWVKIPGPVTAPEKDAASTTAELLRRWLQVHTLEGRIVFTGSEGDDITHVDP